ncbi:MAG: N-acetyltransferase family protein [Bacteroidetes bacterium]|nr:N-acetyltransferase family protein [Bacteroidota bacterium]
MAPVIRLAAADDAKGILDIYVPYIQNTSFTFETELPSVAAFGERIEDYLQSWPWLVYEINGILAGYAYASRYRERTAYQWSVECSVYVHNDFQRMGVAQALYAALFEILKRQGFRNVYAVINLPNEKSVAFHENFGFKYFATYEQVGFKLGKWKNVGWWRLTLNAFDDDPAPPVLFSLLNKNFLPELLREKVKLIRS